MSSKFSVKNFSKDQETLQCAADALMDYMKIGMIWAVGTILVMYAKFGWKGAALSAVMNSIIMYWIYSSYITSFNNAAKKYGLKFPDIRI